MRQALLILVVTLSGCAAPMKVVKYEAGKIVKREIAALEEKLEERILQVMLQQLADFAKTWGAGGAAATMFGAMVGKKVIKRNGKKKEA